MVFSFNGSPQGRVNASQAVMLENLTRDYTDLVLYFYVGIKISRAYNPKKGIYTDKRHQLLEGLSSGGLNLNGRTIERPIT
jgi:hypothetical protein